MALETKQKSIGGRTYEVQQLPARRGERLFVRLVRLLGPAVVGVLGGLMASKVRGLPAQTSAAGKGLGDQEIGPSMFAFFERLSEVEYEQLHDALLETVSVDGRPMLGPAYDIEYRGKIKEVLQVMWFALEVNYADFLPGALALLGDRAKPTRALES